MANYSDDVALAIFYDRVAEDGPWTIKHAEATKEIDRRLRAMGYSNDDIAALSTQTKADLAPAACYYVLHLALLPVNTDKAMDYHKLFTNALNNVRIEVDRNADAVPESTSQLGGQMRLG